MRNGFRRLVAAFFVILMLVTLFPFQVFAVDPVSAATMANALAQALTAYGASHGVSMMFDVSNPSGIGEGLHDLWGQFNSDIHENNVPTYDSLAVTLWTNLYTKVRNSVAINVSAENVEYFDQFWNWLLSGPAEMQRVDDQYYEWSVNQNDTVDPIRVLASYGVFFDQPISSNSNNQFSVGTTNGNTNYQFKYRNKNVTAYSTGDHVYCFCSPDLSLPSIYNMVFCMDSTLPNETVTVLFDGSNQVTIDPHATGALYIDAERNRIYWASADGLYAMPLVKSRNNQYTTTPVQYNNLNNIDLITVNNTPQ